MKNIFLLFIFLNVVVSCKNSEEKKADPPTPETEEITNKFPDKIFKGEFIYMEEGAVLKGRNYVFGVTMDDMAKKLADRVAPAKKEEFDMVFVVVKGTVVPKPADQEGWPQILTITEILEVSSTPAKADVRIEENKN